MESNVKKTFSYILLEIRNLGGIFYFPIIIMFIVVIYISVKYSGYSYQSALPYIKHDFGSIVMPLIGVWIIGSFQDFVETDGKEIILSQPYNSKKYGILKVLQLTLFYFLFLLLFLIILTIVFEPGNINDLTKIDILLAIVSVIYISSLSFFLMVTIKNSLICYILLGCYLLFLYMTRGAFSYGIYPLQWSHPQPYLDNFSCILMLSVSSSLILMVSQIIFQNREYLLKK